MYGAAATRVYRRQCCELLWCGQVAAGQRNKVSACLVLRSGRECRGRAGVGPGPHGAADAASKTHKFLARRIWHVHFIVPVARNQEHRPHVVGVVVMARGEGGPTPQPQRSDHGGKPASGRRVRRGKSDVVVATISTDGLDVERLNR